MKLPNLSDIWLGGGPVAKPSLTRIQDSTNMEREQIYIRASSEIRLQYML